MRGHCLGTRFGIILMWSCCCLITETLFGTQDNQDLILIPGAIVCPEQEIHSFSEHHHTM